jgi:hypothetical protein
MAAIPTNPKVRKRTPGKCGLCFRGTTGTG